ncbi:hypothetical protein EBR21_16430, partial [bacterium]|nr:hypothetical protein [bacterium]
MAKHSRRLLISSLLKVALVASLGVNQGCHIAESRLQESRTDNEPVILRLRWTRGQLADASLDALLARISTENRIQLSKSNFELFEDRALAHMNFRMFEQRHPEEDAPVDGTGIRIWETPSGEIIQVEADVIDEKRLQASSEAMGQVDFAKIRERAVSLLALQEQDNSLVTDVRTSFDVRRGKLQMRVSLRAARGWHTWWFDNSFRDPAEHKYRTFTRQNHFSQNDSADEYSIPARTFPVADAGVNRDYTDNGVRGELAPTQLRHIKKRIPQRNPVRYFPWEARTFLTSNQVSSAKKVSDVDLADGIWSFGAVMGRLLALSTSDAQVINEIGFGNPAR